MQAFYNEDLPQRHKGHGCKFMVKIKKQNMCMLNKLTSLHENLDIVNDKNGRKLDNPALSSSPPPLSDPTDTFLKNLIILLPQASQIHQT